MDVSQTTAQPAWSSQTFQSGELDLKEDTYQAAQDISTPDDSGWGPDGFGFDDFIDIINPLQHLPFVSTLYREFTGDTIAPAARLTGSALYGGPAALLAGLANVIVEAETGSDIGASIITKLTGRESIPANANTQTAEKSLLDKMPQAQASLATRELTPAANHRDFTAPGLQSARTDGTITPEAMAAYARASALTAPKPGHGSVDWASSVITPPPAGSGADIQSVSGRGLDALIRSSQEKNAARRRGPALPSLVQPGLKTRGVQTRAREQALPVNPSQHTGLADWMMKTLDKYGTMKVSGSGVG